jgi:uncharacterized membrane protein HdeD (DUF308 family)
MTTEDQEAPVAFIAARTWQTTLFLGVATVILGLIVSFHPSGSLNVIAVLVGILMIISGIFHLIRVFDTAEQGRVWLGIAGLLYVVIGVVLIRHLHLTVAFIGLLVGLTWIVQGLSGLFGGIAGSREGRGWWIFFGIVSLIAGIVVVSDPITSVTVLAVLLGIWFIVMGLFEVMAAFIIRRAASESLSAQQRFADEGAATLLQARQRDRQEHHHGQRERVVSGRARRAYAIACCGRSGLADGRGAAAAGGPGGRSVARLGTLSQRASVGDGPGGLQRQRGRLVVLHP